MKQRTIRRRRAIKFANKFNERRFGISMEWTWNVDYTFAKFMIPVLKAFKEVKDGYPCELTPEEWDNIIQKIIDGLELILDDSIDLNATIEESIAKEKAKEEKIQESLDLFAKWCRHIWW